MAAIPPALLRRLVDAAEADRGAVADELHDDAVQALAASVMHLGLLERRLPEVAAQPSWGRAKENLEHGLKAARALLVDLRPPALARQGLVPALRQQLERVARQAGCATSLDWHGPERLPPLVEALAFRAAQEALVNAAAHALPGRIAITGTVTGTVTGGEAGVEGGAGGSFLTVEVVDDGPGMPPEAEARCPTAWLHVELAGGAVAVRSAPGTPGTTVQVRVPLP